MMWQTDRESGTSHEPGAWPDFVNFQRRATRIATFTGVTAGEATLRNGGEPARVARVVVTRHFLPLLGVTPWRVHASRAALSRAYIRMLVSTKNLSLMNLVARLGRRPLQVEAFPQPGERGGVLWRKPFVPAQWLRGGQSEGH